MLRLKLFKQYVFVLVLISTSMSVISEILVRPFVSGCFSQILEQRQEKPFVLVLWSLDCPSCFKELEMLGKLSRQYSELDIVLVSTDITATENELQTILTRYKLDNVESWMFSGDSDEHLRYEIDRSWYGELPRSYFFKPSEKKQVVSGLLSEEQLMVWMKIQIV